MGVYGSLLIPKPAMFFLQLYQIIRSIKTRKERVCPFLAYRSYEICMFMTTYLLWIFVLVQMDLYTPR
jgi:hypothetical protein